MRFACLFAPDFPVQAMVRAESGLTACWHDRSVVILDGPASMLRVMACNEAARRAGIEAGMTKPQAEICKDVILRNRSHPAEDAAQAALLECARGFSPRVESTAAGTVTLDLEGTQTLLGAPGKIAREIKRCAFALGLDVNVGIAAKVDVALHAARTCAGITLVPAGHEAEWLAALPIASLQPSKEMADALESWGIRNCSELARLPSVPLVERLGQEGLHLQQLARGAQARMLVAQEPELRFEESLELEEPIELLEPLAFVLNRLLESLAKRLAGHSLAAGELYLALELEVHRDRQLNREENAPTAAFVHQRTLKLPVPTLDTKIFLKLLQLDLAAHPPEASVKRITLRIEPARARSDQAGLFTPLSPDPEKLELTLARIQGVVGEVDANGIARVGSPQLVDSHQQYAFRVARFSTSSEKDGSVPKSVPTVALRVFRPALKATVQVNFAVPVAVAFDKNRARVLAVSGPWRISGQWWDGACAWAREEWDVALALADGVGIYRIYRDLRRGSWFVEGMYD